MKLENQQELEKLIKMLRKTGVESLKLGEIEIKLGPHDPPESKYIQRKRKIADSTDVPGPTGSDFGGYSPEEVAFWSSTPPGAEPEKDQ